MTADNCFPTEEEEMERKEREKSLADAAVEDLVKALAAWAAWVAVNAERVSVWMNPSIHPAPYTVDVEPLLDFVSEQTGIGRERIGAWVKEAAEKAEGER
jgi:copper oxidase (laccase) domain-containing protein